MTTEHTRELAPAQPQAPAPLGFALPGLFQEKDPAAVIAKATAIANHLRNVITEQGMSVKIGDGEHVNIEGLQTLGAFLGGIMSYIVWTRYVESPRMKSVWGYEARAEARYMGLPVTAAEAECWSNEPNWRSKEEHELKSMAQTRACSKALALGLRWILKLAGYSPTPAEEMTGVDARDRAARAASGATALGTCPIHHKQLRKGKYGIYCPTKVPGNDGKERWCKGRAEPQAQSGEENQEPQELPDAADLKNIGELFTACQKHFGMTRSEVLTLLGVSGQSQIASIRDAWHAVLATKQQPPEPTAEVDPDELQSE